MNFKNKTFGIFMELEQFEDSFKNVDLNYDFSDLIKKIEDDNLNVNVLKLYKKKEFSSGNLKFNLYCELEYGDILLPFIFKSIYSENSKEISIELLLGNFDFNTNIPKRDSFLLYLKLFYERLIELIKEDDQIRMINLLNGIKIINDTFIRLLIFGSIFS